MSTDIIQAISDDLREVLQSIAQFDGKAVQVLDANELLDKAKNVTLPAVGVIYEGMRAVGETGKDTQRHGQSAEAIFTIMVAGFQKANTGPEIKGTTLALLGEIRKGLKTRKSPTQHIYRFMVEAAADDVHGTIVWAQRWAVPVPMI